MFDTYYKTRSTEMSRGNGGDDKIAARVRLECVTRCVAFAKRKKKKYPAVDRNDFNSNSARERRRIVGRSEEMDRARSPRTFLFRYPFISVHADVTSVVTQRYIIAEAVMEIARFVTTAAGAGREGEEEEENSLQNGRTGVRRSTIISRRLFVVTDAIRKRTLDTRGRRKREREPRVKGKEGRERTTSEGRVEEKRYLHT
ncbi:hypothetical protein PUN28_001726 [Cardiocondyla obscurior]|uniref:Uncharacterized protein n=1 Tax=Cardiocondyla obscurior TaxID=286306 RepID=A0AAW2GQU7_9HYME